MEGMPAEPVAEAERMLTAGSLRASVTSTEASTSLAARFGRIDRSSSRLLRCCDTSDLLRKDFAIDRWVA